MKENKVLGFQVRRAIKAEDERDAALAQIAALREQALKKGDEMSKDLLVLADEYAAATATFARALALKDEADSMSPIAREAGDKRAVLAEALAALDTAQPVQVNAVLVEALETCGQIDRQWQYFDADKVRLALTAAKQAQPPAPGEAAREYMTGYSNAKEWARATNQAQQAQSVPEPVLQWCDKCGEGTVQGLCRGKLDDCKFKQAQPERAPLTDAEIEKLVMPYGFSSIQGFDHIKAYTRRVEAYIKQGGQQ